MVGKGMTPLSEDQRTTQVNFKIAVDELRLINIAADELNLSRSAFIRKCVMTQINSPELKLSKLDIEIKEVELKLAVKKAYRDEILHSVQASKTIAANRDEAILKEIDSLLVSLKYKGGKVDKIKQFIFTRTSTLNNNFPSSTPLTVDELTNRLVEHAEAQGVHCHV